MFVICLVLSPARYIKSDIELFLKQKKNCEDREAVNCSVFSLCVMQHWVRGSVLKVFVNGSQ